jgi:adenylate cyclase
VVTTWVGEAKKELAFHGDALNVTARMQGHCRSLGALCLVSVPLLSDLDALDDFEVSSMGAVDLRGRSGVLEVSSIEFVRS